jgi:hypothetical protein
MNSRFSVNPPHVERLDQGAPDFVDATESTALCYETSAWPQRTIDPRKHLVGSLDPMQRGIAEDSVKFLAIGQCHRVNYMSNETEFFGPIR